VAVLDAGKHLFVEKPMAMSQLEAEAMLRAARRKSRRGMVGHLLLYHPAVAEMRRAAACGELGDIQAVVAHRASPLRADRAEGAWWTLGPHDVSLACHLLAGQPLGVRARFYRRGQLPEHRAQAWFDFPAGRTALLCTRFRNGRARRVALIGSRRMLVFDDNWPSCRLRLFDTPGGACSSIAQVDALARGPSLLMPPLPGGEPLAIEVQHFVDGLLDGEAFRSGLDEGLSVVAWLEAAEKASVASGAQQRVFGSAPASPGLPLVV
jgi:predicted dehydrogenase